MLAFLSSQSPSTIGHGLSIFVVNISTLVWSKKWPFSHQNVVVLSFFLIIYYLLDLSKIPQEQDLIFLKILYVINHELGNWHEITDGTTWWSFLSLPLYFIFIIYLVTFLLKIWQDVQGELLQLLKIFLKVKTSPYFFTIRTITGPD